MVKRNGPYGEFYGCSTYPKCKGSWSQANEDRKASMREQHFHRMEKVWAAQASYYYRKDHMRRMGYTRPEYGPGWKSSMDPNTQHEYDDYCGFSSGDFGDN
jgi:ssDNA-binding Zn-finger/Zn-ribbon topoisomerase 1